MSDEAAFLAALQANPADDTTRLVYADWLDEHREPAKAEYLRLVALLAQCKENLASAPEAPRLCELAPTLPEEWRTCTGSRFNVILDGFADKVKTIKWLREITGDGLGECKAASEALPYTIYECIPFELASAISANAQPMSTAKTRITASESVSNPPDRSYTVAVYCYAPTGPDPVLSQEEILARRQAESDARKALVSLIVAARGLSAEEAAALAVIAQQIVLGDRLTLQEARAFHFKLRPLIPTWSTNRGWNFWVRRYQPVG